MKFSESSKQYHLRREQGMCGRHGCPERSGRASLCRAHLEQQRHRTASREAKRKQERRALSLATVGTLAAQVFVAVALLITMDNTARGDNTAISGDARPMRGNLACACVEPANGARDGETLRDRVARLETALRLSKAEAVVNRGRRAKAR